MSSWNSTSFSTPQNREKTKIERHEVRSPNKNHHVWLVFETSDKYGVRGVSQIKFTMSDSFLVFYDFDILSMIKRKNPFRFYCVILILNLLRLISQMHF